MSAKRSKIPVPVKKNVPNIIVNVPARATTDVTQRSKRTNAIKKGFTKITQNRANRTQKTSFDFDSVFRELFTTFTRALSNPSVVLSVIITVAFVLSHDIPQKKGFIFDTFADKTDSMSKWIYANVTKIIGGLIFLPSLLDSPNRYRSMLMMSVVAWVALVPEYSIIEYTVQSIAMHTFFKVRTQHAKMFIIGVAVVAYFFGFIKLPRVSINSAAESITTAQSPTTTTARSVPKG